MFSYSTLYQVLNVAVSASTGEIKTAFRKLSLEHHPDMHGNSPESNSSYAFILNAYKILADPAKRKEYDAFLANSIVLKSIRKSRTQGALPGKSQAADKSGMTLLAHFNFLLWELEDYIHTKQEADWNLIISGFTLRQYVLKILTFMDKWVLEPAGFPDYFMEARQRERLDPRSYVETIGTGRSGQGHAPYAGLTDYFFNIRKRTNALLDKTKPSDLVKPVAGYAVMLVDCITEAHNLAMHYLSYLLQTASGSVREIPVFQHSRSCFTAPG